MAATTETPETATSEEPTTESSEKKGRGESTYVVLLGERYDDDTFGFRVLDTVIVPKSGGQRAARRKALMNHDDVKDSVQKGDEVMLAAIPESSWKPTPPRKREPREATWEV